MLDQQLYVREKLEESRRDSRPGPRRLQMGSERPNLPQRSSRRPLAPILRLAGIALRRTGETLESWAAHPHAEDVAR